VEVVADRHWRVAPASGAHYPRNGLWTRSYAANIIIIIIIISNL